MSIQLKKYQEELYICAKCGYCRNECAVWKIVGYDTVSPRGKILLLKHFLEQKKEIPQELIDNWYLCCTCGKCKVYCPTDIDFPELVRTLRIKFAQDIKKIPQEFLKTTKNIIENGNPLGLDIEDRNEWRPDDLILKKHSKNLFYVGCLSSYWTMDSPELITKILNKIDFDFTLLENEPCCGYIEFWSGEIEKAKEIAQKLASTIEAAGIEMIFTACPGCYSTLKHDYQKLNINLNVEVLHISELFAKLIKDGKLKFNKNLNTKVTYHDPCHLGRFHGIYEAPREILKALPGVELIEMENNKQYSNCCGGPLRTSNLEFAENIGKKRAEEAFNTKATYVTTICPQCLISLRQSAALLKYDYEVVDLNVLIAMALGIE